MNMFLFRRTSLFVFQWTDFNQISKVAMIWTVMNILHNMFSADTALSNSRQYLHHQSHLVLDECQQYTRQTLSSSTQQAHGEHSADTIGRQHSVNTRQALDGIGGVSDFA